MLSMVEHIKLEIFKKIGWLFLINWKKVFLPKQALHEQSVTIIAHTFF